MLLKEDGHNPSNLLLRKALIALANDCERNLALSVRCHLVTVEWKKGLRIVLQYAHCQDVLIRVTFRPQDYVLDGRPARRTLRLVFKKSNFAAQYNLDLKAASIFCTSILLARVFSCNYL